MALLFRALIVDPFLKINPPHANTTCTKSAIPLLPTHSLSASKPLVR